MDPAETMQAVIQSKGMQPERSVRRNTRWLRFAMLVWLLSMLVVQGGGAPSAQRRQTQLDWESGSLKLTATDVVRSVRAYLSDANDMRRYYAYASALLGRPYYGYYVRSAESWQQQFRAGTKPPSDDSALVVPMRPLVPYRDYLIEYPPGVLLVTVPPALLLPSGDYGDAYDLLFLIEMIVTMGVSIQLALRLRRHLPKLARSELRFDAAMWWACAIGCFALGTVVTHRFDPVVALLLVGLALAVFDSRWFLSGVLLSLATICKGVPLLLAPLWLWFLWVRTAEQTEAERFSALGRVVLGGLLCGLAFVIPLYVSSGLSMLDALRYHGERPLQLESTGAALLGTLQALYPGTLRSTVSYGSANVVTIGSSLIGLEWLLLRMQGPAVLAGLIGTLSYCSYRRRSMDSLNQEAMTAELVLRSVCLLMVVFMVSGRVFSPQYLTWIIPLGIFLSLRVSTGLTALFLLLLALSQIIVSALGGPMLQIRAWAFGILLARNLLLFVWGVRLLRARISRAS